MAYKVSEIVRSDKGYSFDITNEKNVPLVHFLYLRESDAIASAKQVRVAVAHANWRLRSVKLQPKQQKPQPLTPQPFGRAALRG